MTREERATYWRRLIDKQVASGLNPSGFCREHEISLQRFYHWRRRFGEQAVHEKGAGFFELVPCSDHPHSGVRIRLGQRLCVEVERGFDPLTLRGVVEAICNGGQKECSL
jgi:hypothetical protein